MPDALADMVYYMYPDVPDICISYMLLSALRKQITNEDT